MKKIFLFILLFIVVSNTCSAQFINKDEARQRAGSFIVKHFESSSLKSQEGMKKTKFSTNELDLVYTQVDKINGIPAFYVFQKPQSEGYVIASAEDRVVPIYCYSNEGTFNKDSIPCCFKALLDNFEQKVAIARVKNLPKFESPLNEENDYPSISPITKSNWHQGSPINQYCPIDKDTGQRCRVGCVASALAQLMYYYNWPEHGVGSHSYQWRDTILSANFEDVEYRYDKMKAVVQNPSWKLTEEQADAMATINYHCGVAVDMDYSSRSSGSFIDKNKAMESFFKYKLMFSLGYNERLYYGLGFLEDVYFELSHSHPLLAGGEGHAYIVDGYQTGGFIHLNLGSGYASCYISILEMGKGWYDGEEGKDPIKIWNSPDELFSYIPDKFVDEVEIDKTKYYICDERAKLVNSNASGDVVIPPFIFGSDDKTYNVKCIGDRAFYENENITSISFPNTIRTIGIAAFRGCYNLTGKLVIPNSVINIGDYAFESCYNFTGIELSNSLINIGDFAFSYCIGLTGELVIPSSVTSIGWAAFAERDWPEDTNCGFSRITIPNSVTYIGGYAFAHHDNLKDIYVARMNPAEYKCGNNAFEDVPFSTCTLHVPNGCKEVYAATVPWSYFNNIVEDEELGIDNTLSDSNDVFRNTIYSINGIKINEKDNKGLSKGIYIQGNKKIIK